MSLQNYNISSGWYSPDTEDENCDESPLIVDWRVHTDDLCSAIFKAFGIRCYAVTTLFHRSRPMFSNPSVYAEAVVQLEPLQYNSTLSEGLEWIDRDAALAADWQSLYHDLNITQLLTVYFARMDGKAPTSSSPWRAIGWLARTESWVSSIIKRQGMKVEVENLLLDGTTVDNWRSSKSIYLKAIHPSVPELKATLTVAATLKGIVPKILGVDEKRNALVQVGAQNLDDLDPKEVSKMLAALHINSLQHGDVLKAGNVPYRWLSWLSSSIAKILCHPVLELCRNQELIHSLRGRVSELQRVCARLMACGIPDTLVHGDCDESNIKCGVEPGHTFSLMDWANCFIGHPLFDLVRLSMNDIWWDVPFEEAKELYFEAWAGFSCRQKMSEAISLVLPLYLCYTLSLLLDTYEIMEPAEQPSRLLLVEGRVEYIDKSLDEICTTDRCARDGDGEEPSIYHFVILNSSEGSILARWSESKMRLPILSPPREDTSMSVVNWNEDTDRLRRIIRVELDLNVYILRPLWVRPNSRNRVEEVVLVLELLEDNSNVLDGFKWIGRQEALSCEWDVIDPRVEVSELLSILHDEISLGCEPEGRVPWRSAVWLKEMLSWVATALSQVRMGLAKPVEVIRNTPISCVLRCDVRHIVSSTVDSPSSDNAVYVKAEHPRLSMVKGIPVISSIYTDIMPAVVAVDFARNAYIEWDAGSVDNSNIKTDKLMRSLADLQIHSINHLERLKDSGVPVRNTEWLSRSLTKILSSPILDICGDGDSVAKLRAETPRLQRCRSELLSFNIPDTLVHGDFHLGNVGSLVNDAYYHIFDWSNAYIGHPFCDFAVMQLTSDGAALDKEIAESIYFGFWKRHGDVAALRRVSQLAYISYFCCNLDILQTSYEAVEVIDLKSISKLCKQSVHAVLYRLSIRFAKRMLLNRHGKLGF